MRPSACRIVPLVARADSAIVFRTPNGAITAAELLAEAARLAEQLPPCTRVVNRRTDPAGFTAGLLATAMRGGVSVLASDASPAAQARIAVRYPEAVTLSDDAGPLAKSGRGALASACAAGSTVAATVFTSGSTGHPVAHEKTWGALAARSTAAARRFRLGRRPASIVATVPPQHMYGLETSVMLPLHTSCAAWSGAAFFPADVAAALRMMPPPRVLVTTPLQMRALLDSGVRFPPVRTVISATAPLPVSLAAAVERHWATRVMEIFGATEVGSIASRRTTDGDEWSLYTGVRLAADGTVRAPGASPARVADVVDVLTPRRFRLLGRASDIVKRGGKRASLAALNAALLDIEGIRDGAFHVPDRPSSPAPRPVLVVVAPALTGAAIIARLRQVIDSAFLPRRVVFVDELPRSPLGKLPAANLAALATTEP